MKTKKLETYFMSVAESYAVLNEGLRRSPERLSVSEDRALAEFRGFHAVASVYVKRVGTAKVIEFMREILADLDGSLAAQEQNNVEVKIL